MSSNFPRPAGSLVFPPDEIARALCFSLIMNDDIWIADTANEDLRYFQTYFVLISLANEKAAAPNMERKS